MADIGDAAFGFHADDDSYARASGHRRVSVQQSDSLRDGHDETLTYGRKPDR
jgi:hypothetical protein